MRIQTLLLWALAMLCGTVLMFIAGLVWFPLESTQIARDVPQSQVLVAKQDIPAGTRIHAQFVEFRFVPVRSIPVGATTDFRRIDNRKTLYPIAEGAPICDMDLDTPLFENANEQLHVPFGMSVVRIQVERIQTTSDPDTLADSPALGPVGNGNEISAEVLSQIVHPGDTVDLMLVETAQKVELSSNRSPFGLATRIRPDSGGKDTVYHRKPTQLIASGLKVHAFSEKVTRESSPVSGNETTTSAATQPVISLLMSKDQLNEVKKAAKLGRLQIVLQSQNETDNEPVQEETNLPQSTSRARLIVQASATENQSRSFNVHTAQYCSTKHQSKTYTAHYTVESPDEALDEADDAFAEVPVESFDEPIAEPVEETVEETMPEIASEPEPMEEPVVEEPTSEPVVESVECGRPARIMDHLIAGEAPAFHEDESVECGCPASTTDYMIADETPAILEEEPVVESMTGPTLAPPFPEVIVNTATEPTLAPPLPEVIAKTTTEPTLAPPLPKITEQASEQVSEPVVVENPQDQEILTSPAPEVSEKLPEKITLPKTSVVQSSRSGKQQPVVKIGLTPLKRRQARLERTHQVPPQTVKSTVKPDQVPPNDSITREYDPNDTPETSQEVVRIASFARNKKIDLYPHYFYEPTSLLLSPDRVAIKEHQPSRPATTRR